LEDDKEHFFGSDEMAQSGKAEKQRDADSRSNRRARFETEGPAAQPGQDHIRADEQRE
jgi:hypothetical protein